MLAPGTGRTDTARLWAYARDERPWAGPSPPAACYRFSPDRRSTRSATSRRSPAGCTPTPTRATASSTDPAPSARWPAWPTSGAGSSTSIARGDPRSPRTPSGAEDAIGRIANLYALEAAARSLAPPEPIRLRQAGARPVLDELDLTEAQLPTLSGRSPLAGAIRHALVRLPRPRPYREHGPLEIDNNPAERAMRGLALGRKNHPFVGSQAGGHAATAYTPIKTAKLNGVDPHAGLADTLAPIPDRKITRIDELLP